MRIVVLQTSLSGLMLSCTMLICAVASHTLLIYESECENQKRERDLVFLHNSAIAN
jgi:hypothetical protein